MSFVATPTKTVRASVGRALQLVQKTNSWTKHVDLQQERDSQGKTRSSFCLRGALRAAVAGKTEAAETPGPTLVLKASKAIMKTVAKNPTRYGYEEGDNVSVLDGVVSFNDRSTTEHKHVVRALRDTRDRLEATSNRRIFNTLCGE